jgi:hypothetical protein
MASSEARAAFSEVLRESIGPTLSAAGYRGRGGTWTGTSSLGDFAVVNVQRSRGTWPGAEDQISFYVNLAVVPLPWWEWLQARHGTMRDPKEFHGLWRRRLHTSQASYVDTWWIGGDDTAQKTGSDVSTQLLQHGLSWLSELFVRENLITSIRRNERFIQARPEIAMAALLTDLGMTDELHRLLSSVPGHPFPADQFRAWAYARASSRESEPAVRSESIEP